MCFVRKVGAQVGSPPPILLILGMNQAAEIAPKLALSLFGDRKLTSLLTERMPTRSCDGERNDTAGSQAWAEIKSSAACCHL